MKFALYVLIGAFGIGSILYIVSLLFIPMWVALGAASKVQEDKGSDNGTG